MKKFAQKNEEKFILIFNVWKKVCYVLYLVFSIFNCV